MGRKWANIKEKKATKDANNSRVYAKFGIEIYVAAKSGDPDPHANQKLRFVLERAKTYNVPKAIIDRAIEKAKGSGDETYSELRYEGFGPNGSMVIVDALTNNVNRTAADVRAAFTKSGGNMGVSGSAAYLFDNTAVIGIENSDADQILEWLLEAELDIRDIFTEEEQVIIYAEPADFSAVKKALQDAGIENFFAAELDLIPQNEVELLQEDQEKFEKILDTLEDLEDVQRVYHNVALS